MKQIKPKILYYRQVFEYPYGSMLGAKVWNMAEISLHAAERKREGLSKPKFRPVYIPFKL
jgi:hypothetical protein